MTRLLCCSDLHVGAGGAHRRDPLADQAATLAEIVKVADERQVDGVLIAGDVFHRPRPTPPELHLFADFARALGTIPTVACHGNSGHDLVNGDEPTALELFATRHFRVSRVPEAFKVIGGVTICTLPSTPVHRLVAQTGMSRDEANEQAASLLVEAAAILREQARGGHAVLMAHWSVSGAALPSGMPVAELHEPVIPLDELEAQGWDAIVLGHIHRGQLLGDGLVWYCGSPMTMDFGEAGFPHGVWIIDLAPGEYDVRGPEFVPLPDRRFLTFDIDLTDLYPRMETTKP